MLTCAKEEGGAFEENGTFVDGVNVRIVKRLQVHVVVYNPYHLWNRSKKQRVSINCPATVDRYNNWMVGVDAVDALISY